MPKQPSYGAELRRLRREDHRNLNLMHTARAAGVTIPQMSDIERDAGLVLMPRNLANLLVYLNKRALMPYIMSLATLPPRLEQEAIE